MDLKAIRDWWPLIAASAAGVYGYATLQADVANLKERVGALEAKPAAQSAIASPIDHRVTKGDLCEQLFNGLLVTRDEQKIARIRAEAEKLNCYEGVAASMGTVDNTSAESETAPRP